MLFNLFKKKYKDFVEISRGKIYFKPITMKIYNKCYSLSSLNYNGKIVVNNALLFNRFEISLVCLSKRKYNDLIIKDALLVRAKLKEILIRENLMSAENKSEGKVDLSLARQKQLKEAFSNKDKDWFNNQYSQSQKNLGVKDGR